MEACESRMSRQMQEMSDSESRSAVGLSAISSWRRIIVLRQGTYENPADIYSYQLGDLADVNALFSATEIGRI